ncbi:MULTISPECIES: hypothetical protein [Roseivirga]|uniref:Uncharacterized protein n=1 Tax=Roseivirga spongicola TaxID=333140 RepID=A0A150XAB3_9BACT|nr:MULTISPECIES: hypothetical protein [Roseivirga]KYG75653.1 hypothetical protein AWW68_07405 [Roseivirga spongicola]MBO6662418.1 hypothetical protein [Roseivirga sp.]MBO6910018.1 hypothetical protein [Roseivirga sp.]WPZ10784.1 hypothetical protein T7867_01560 [Roseivirga spongicola]
MMKIRVWKVWLLSSLIMAIAVYFSTSIDPLDLDKSNDVQLHDTYFVIQNWSFLLIWTLLFLIINGIIALIYKLIRYFIACSTP